MKSGKRVLSILIVSLLLIISVGLVSAALKDWFGFGNKDKNLEGELPAAFNIGIQMTNQAPTITSWTIPTGSPNGDCTPTALGNFVVTVTDPDGGADLSDGVVTLKLTNTHASLGLQTRTAVSCAAGTPVGNTLAFTCSGISMNYWDDGGVGDPWTVTVTATDGTNAATNSPKTSVAVGDANYPHFVYTSLIQAQVKDANDADYVSGDDTISWLNIQTTSADVVANGPPNPTYLTVRTCGNGAITTTSLTGKKLDCTACSPATDICPNSFSVRAAVSPCNVGDVLNWPAAAKAIAASGLAVSTGSDITKPFYFCLEDINPVPSAPDTCLDPITVGTYDSTGNAWDITFAFILSLIKFIKFNFEFSILLSVIALRTKKRKIKKKLKTKNKLLSHKELSSLDLILKKKYNVSVKELLEEAKEKQIREEFEIKSEIKVPLNIFNKKLSPAEVLCKYLKENKKMKFSEIAKLINRDERSVWTNYNNAIKKMREKIKEDKKIDKTILVSINIFSNRKLSILESVVKYLKEKAYRNCEIAELLGKDQRNIYTIYNRAKKKLE